MTDHECVQTIVIENRMADYIVIVSLREPAATRFVITLSREAMTDHAEVVEEWYLKKGQRCTIELEEDETVSLDDRIGLSMDQDPTHDHAETTTHVIIKDLLQ